MNRSASHPVEQVLAGTAVVGLVIMFAIITGPVSRLVELRPLLLVFGGATAIAVMAAPFRVHLRAWRLALDADPLDPDVARRARVLLKAQARGLLVMGVVGAVVELIHEWGSWTSPEAAQALANATLRPVLYGVGAAGMFVWPLQSAVAWRTGLPAAEALPRTPATPLLRALVGVVAGMALSMLMLLVVSSLVR